MEKPCPNCGVVFTALRKEKLFCSARCQGAAAQKRRNKPAALANRECPQCGVSFTPTRADKKFCSNTCCVKFNTMKRAQPAATRVAAADSSVTTRLFADGFYLGSLRDEIERVRKSRNVVASLEAQLRSAMIEDALWPVGKVGRIALTLALLRIPSLLALPVQWRHPHEHRRKPGEAKKRTGVGIRAYGVPGARS